MPDYNRGFVLCAPTRNVEASLIKSAEFQDCVQTDLETVCEEKMSVTMPVSYGLTRTIEVEVAGDPNVRIEVTKELGYYRTEPVL